MRTNMNIGMQKSFLHIRHVNPGLNQNKVAMEGGKQQGLKDILSISSRGKASSFIESLMKQKQNITEMKDKLVGKTLEKGGDMDSIKVQLEYFEEQLKNIDEQIAQTIAEQSKKQAEAQKEIIYKKPNTESEIQTERLNFVVDLSTKLIQTQALSSVKTRIDGESRVLEMEIKLDESRGGASTSKKERLGHLKQQSANIATQMNKGFIEMGDEIKSSNDSKLVKSQDTETKQKTGTNIVGHIGDEVNNVG